MPDYPDVVVERVAVALAESRCWPGCWEKANEVEKSAWRHDAKAAIAAAWEWKDISEAPKDGTRFLAWFPQNRHEQIFPVAWAENIYDEGFGWTLDDGESAVLTYDSPTHWMPLPPAPEVKS